MPARALPPLAKIMPLRVGILTSYGFCKNEQGYNLAGLLEKLPKGRITWYGYIDKPDDHSAVRRRNCAGLDYLIISAGMTDHALAERMRRDRIDMLLFQNPAWHGARQKIIALHPVPIQISMLTMAGTFGADTMDYILGDKTVTPAAQVEEFTEKILQLPRSYFANDDQQPDFSLAGTRAEHNLPEDVPVFCCFNQAYKYSPETFALWGKIMQAVPNAVLWLLPPAWRYANHGQAITQCLQKQLQAAGIDPARLVLAQVLSHAEHLARISHADLFLDTLPYNAHTTCSDSLQASVPVLTLPGNRFASRVAASILTTANLPEWIARDEQDYVQKAIAFASKPKPERDAIKAEVFRTYWSSPMPDNVSFAKLLENLCINLYNRHASGLPKTHLCVSQNGELTELQ